MARLRQRLAPQLLKKEIGSYDQNEKKIVFLKQHIVNRVKDTSHTEILTFLHGLGNLTDVTSAWKEALKFCMPGIVGKFHSMYFALLESDSTLPKEDQTRYARIAFLYEIVRETDFLLQQKLQDELKHQHDPILNALTNDLQDIEMMDFLALFRTEISAWEQRRDKRFNYRYGCTDFEEVATQVAEKISGATTDPILDRINTLAQTILNKRLHIAPPGGTLFLSADQDKADLGL